MPTPVEWYPDHGGIYLKRDDLFVAPGGAPGGKARTCHSIIMRGLRQRYGFDQSTAGVVTAGSRSSPQVNIVAQICRSLGVSCRVHTPTGKPGPEVEAAVAAGAERVEHFPGYNTVIVKRAEDDARDRGWVLVPFGMDHWEAVHQTAKETTEESIAGARRIVVPVGSGMSLCGILTGMNTWQYPLPVLGVIVGADPTRRLDKYAPMWRFMDVELVQAGVPYDAEVEASVGGVTLDPIYEAKAVKFLQPGDLLWVVGIRQTLKLG